MKEGGERGGRERRERDKQIHVNMRLTANRPEKMLSMLTLVNVSGALALKTELCSNVAFACSNTSLVSMLCAELIQQLQRKTSRKHWCHSPVQGSATCGSQASRPCGFDFVKTFKLITFFRFTFFYHCCRPTVILEVFNCKTCSLYIE